MIARVDAAPSEVTALWARYDIHGVHITVESDVSAASDAVATAYGAFAESRPVGHDSVALVVRRDETRFRLVDHRGRASVVPTGTDAVLGLLDRVVEAVLDGLAGRGILGTHAGVVEIGGRAFLLAGQSGRGKSTLTLGLVRRGAGFLTDELALITSTDTVLPYPRALHVRPSTVDLLPELEFLRARPRHDLGAGSEWSVTIDDLVRAFETRTPGPIPLGGIVLIGTEPDPNRTPVIVSMSAIMP